MARCTTSPHRYDLAMADNKQTKTVGEHLVASALARRGWAPALTRDGLERTDILAVATHDPERRMVEIQVKTATGRDWPHINWLLGAKAQSPSRGQTEYFVLVAVPNDLSLTPRTFVVPRSHIAAAAWIQHMAWLTDPNVPAGTRNAPVNLARVYIDVFERYEDRWDLLMVDQDAAPVLLPPRFRDLAALERVGLPPEHSWGNGLPEWP